MVVKPALAQVRADVEAVVVPLSLSFFLQAEKQRMKDRKTVAKNKVCVCLALRVGVNIMGVFVRHQPDAG